jgi:MYXO-CTERM domain-containing protein
VGAPCSAADIAANKCGGCITNLDCTLAGKRTCFLGTHTCVECTLDAECAGANFCDTAAHACTPKLDNGTPVPTIAGHTPALTGDCSAAVGTAVCKSGVCDTTDDDCGYPNGHVCIGSSECRSASCSSITKVCVPAGGCAADADCAAGKFCDTGASLCKDKLANGTPIPTITGHTPAVSGNCTPAAATVVCVSGVCDNADDKCGYPDGHPCVSGTQCRGAICTAGTCGSADAGTDVGVDTGSTDTGSTDTGSADTGSADTGSGDTGSADTGSADTGAVDSGSSDSGSDAADTAVDSGELDTGSSDSGDIDSGEIDSGASDTGADIDGSLVEDGGDDGGATSPEEGTLEGGGFSCSAGRSSSSGVGFLSLSLAALLAVTRRRRV